MPPNFWSTPDSVDTSLIGAVVRAKPPGKNAKYNGTVTAVNDGIVQVDFSAEIGHVDLPVDSAIEVKDVLGEQAYEDEKQQLEHMKTKRLAIWKLVHDIYKHTPSLFSAETMQELRNLRGQLLSTGLKAEEIAEQEAHAEIVGKRLALGSIASSIAVLSWNEAGTSWILSSSQNGTYVMTLRGSRLQEEHELCGPKAIAHQAICSDDNGEGVIFDSGVPFCAQTDSLSEQYIELSYSSYGRPGETISLILKHCSDEVRYDIQLDGLSHFKDISCGAKIVLLVEQTAMEGTALSVGLRKLNGEVISAEVHADATWDMLRWKLQTDQLEYSDICLTGATGILPYEQQIVESDIFKSSPEKAKLDPRSQ